MPSITTRDAYATISAARATRRSAKPVFSRILSAALSIALLLAMLPGTAFGDTHYSASAEEEPPAHVDLPTDGHTPPPRENGNEEVAEAAIPDKASAQEEPPAEQDGEGGLKDAGEASSATAHPDMQTVPQDTSCTDEASSDSAANSQDAADARPEGESAADELARSEDAAGETTADNAEAEQGRLGKRNNERNANARTSSEEGDKRMASPTLSATAEDTQAKGASLSTQDEDDRVFAVFDSSDGSLRFYNRPSFDLSATQTRYEGSTYEVRDGGEKLITSADDVPWKDVRASIASVEFVDDVFGFYTDWWFYGCTALESVDFGPWANGTSEFVGTDDPNACGSMQSCSHMFDGCRSLASIDMASVARAFAISSDTSYLFHGCASLTSLDFTEWYNLSSDMSYMFAGCTSLRSVNLGCFLPLGEMENMFEGCTGLRSVTVSDSWSFTGLGSSSVNAVLPTVLGGKWENEEAGIAPMTASELAERFDDNASSWAGTWTPTSAAYGVLQENGALVLFRSMESYAHNADYADVVDVAGSHYAGRVFADIEKSGRTYANCRWRECKNDVRSIRVAPGQTVKPASTRYWFYDHSSLESVDLNGLDTSDVTDMRYMFGARSADSALSSLASLDLTMLDTSSVEDMRNMFSYCTALAELDISSFDTSSTTTEQNMFDSCTSLRRITLGNSFSFNGKGAIEGNDDIADKGLLPTPPNDIPHTGLWLNSSISAAKPVTAEQLQTYYDGSVGESEYCQPIAAGETLEKASFASGTYMWATDACTIRFASGQGQNTETLDVVVRASESYALPAPTFTRHLYAQTGWADDRGESWALSSIIPANTYANGDVIVMTALWSALEYATSDTENIAFTVPDSINYTLAAHGTLTGPTLGAYLENLSAFQIRASALDVDPEAGWTVVADAAKSDASNSVDFQIGPRNAQAEAHDYLTKSDLPDSGAWNMGAAGSDAAVLQLVCTGHVANAESLPPSKTELANLHWYVKAS